MHGPRKYRRGSGLRGGGGPGPSATNFFSHQLNLRFFFKENYNFPRLQRGSNIFRGGGGEWSNFNRGGGGGEGVKV